uniref:TaqI-like C-terminal specificity domain-containing protein n=1 Tax=Prevotella sp. TaxID=59823 RepID=UPI0027E312C6
VCEFANSDSWVILSPIEQSIKRKIEAVGTPLKDWDINIYRGVLTGYNEAFIISTEKRKEILANCQSEDERERTAELIRPILRGRDIKRYGYNWANLWLINTHNGIRGKLERIHIEDYPAVKAHLDQYWDRISKRADKGDTPYNLRNCAYLEDFSKPKIIWKIIGSRLAFTMDKEGYIVNNACYLMTGEYLLHVLAFLNSSPLIWYSEITNMNKTGVGDAQVGAQNIILFPIPKQTQKDGEITSVVNSLLNEYSEENANRLQNLIYDVFGLTNEESDYLSKMNL